MYAEVLIEYSAKSIDQSFTYHIPKSLEDSIKVGMKVKVHFGKNTINGFVTKINKSSTIDNINYEIKDIISIDNQFITLNDELLKLGEYLQYKTLCTKISAYETMLPSSLKVDKKTNDLSKYIYYIELNKNPKDIDNYINNNKRCKKQIEILNNLKEQKRILKCTYDSSIINILLEKDLIKLIKEQIYRLDNISKSNKVVNLNEDQLNVVNQIDLNNQKTYLIHGVTGSGKTEVYIELIKKVIKLNKTAILLVPEISLTTQIVQRFYNAFGSLVAIFHSALSEGEKYDEYLKIVRGEVKIVVGTRSAIFTPLNNLGLIIIDEEHSENYKQDSSPRYHALDMALFRSKYHNIPLVLGSATPSLESMARAQKGVYKYISMTKRIGNSKLPKINIIDMTNELKKRNTIFSNKLKDLIADRLIKKEQSIILLNRRGFSTVISCKSCGYTYKCPNCDITLTYHKSVNNLRCHYCGYSIIKENKCPSCHEEALYDYGLGTEKLEIELKKIFPSARILRMDADTTRLKGAHEKIITQFKNHEYDILLGTQMISKGFDFPLVTLVGIIDADSTLNIPDFRSGERTFSLLSQTSGRAGRSDLPGEVVIQTFNPDNFTIQCVKDNDYLKFYNYEMNNRHKLDYPPYYYLTLIRITSKDYKLASEEITKVKNYLNNKIKSNIILLGPTPANIFKLKNIYRFQIILKYKKESDILSILNELDNIYKTNSKVNLEIDNNPLQI